MSEHDQFRIHLSLVSHTNIGKTTLARTLLMRDVGEVADRAHVTETTDDYVLARDSAGCELVLWDTPGFGNSVALAKRLAGRSNPIGWFLSEIWDRMTNKAFWLNQRAIKHVRDVSSVVLYLVNASDLPKTAPYITAEMQILSWINKPVIVLLNQMGKPRTHAEELADVAAWREAMAPYPFVKDILPMDAFARCWVQETALFDAIGRALPSEMHSTFDTLRDIWTRSRRALYLSSVDAMARHMWRLLQAHELVPAPTLKDHLRSFGSQIGLIKTRNEALEDAQTALSAMAADSLCSLTDKLIGINGLTGSGVSREILRRMKTDWQMASHSISPGPAAAVGAGVGVAGGAAAGAAADMASAGLSLGHASGRHHRRHRRRRRRHHLQRPPSQGRDRHLLERACRTGLHAREPPSLPGRRPLRARPRRLAGRRKSRILEKGRAGRHGRTKSGLSSHSKAYARRGRRTAHPHDGHAFAARLHAAL